MFSYYSNEGSDDIINHSTKTVQHSIKNISGNIRLLMVQSCIGGLYNELGVM